MERLLVELRRREEQHTEFARDIGRARAWTAASTYSVERALRGMADAAQTEPAECDGDAPGVVFRNDDRVEVAVGVFGLVVGLISLWVLAGGPAKLEDWSEGGDDDG